MTHISNPSSLSHKLRMLYKLSLVLVVSLLLSACPRKEPPTPEIPDVGTPQACVDTKFPDNGEYDSSTVIDNEIWRKQLDDLILDVYYLRLLGSCAGLNSNKLGEDHPSIKFDVVENDQREKVLDIEIVPKVQQCGSKPHPVEIDVKDGYKLDIKNNVHAYLEFAYDVKTLQSDSAKNTNKESLKSNPYIAVVDLFFTKKRQSEIGEQTAQNADKLKSNINNQEVEKDVSFEFVACDRSPSTDTPGNSQGGGRR